MSQPLRFSIPVLQIGGNIITAAYTILLYVFLGGDLSNYIPMGLVPLVGISLGVWALGQRWSEENACRAFLFMNVLTLTVVLLFFPVVEHPFIHWFSTALYLVAVVDSGLVMSQRLRIFCHSSAAVLVFALLIFKPASRDLLVVGPMFLLLAWKILVNFHFSRMLEGRIQANQVKAFRATVVTLNHEFNNVAAVTEGLLMKIQGDQSSAVTIEPSDLAMLDRNLKRLVRLIKRFRGLKAYEEIEYLGEVKMVELPADQGN